MKLKKLLLFSARHAIIHPFYGQERSCHEKRAPRYCEYARFRTHQLVTSACGMGENKQPFGLKCAAARIGGRFLFGKFC